MSKNESWVDRIFLGVIYVLMVLMIIFTIYPFWEVIVLSISSKKEAMSTGLRLYTAHPDFTAYKYILGANEIWRSFYNSVVRVVLATLISLILTALTAYPLSKEDLRLKKTFTGILIITMMFNGGMIPTYLVMKNLGLLDSLWVLVLPGAVAAYNVIIMRNFYLSIPSSLEESAKIDGANDFYIWWKIIIPLSKPALATIALWVAVANWNAYFDALIYITDRSKYVLSIILRRILLENQVDVMISAGAGDTLTSVRPMEETVKSALIVVSTIPIVIVYPFIQKYFTKGIMLGAVKG